MNCEWILGFFRDGENVAQLRGNGWLHNTVNMLNATKLYTFIYYYFYLEYKVVGFIML